MRWLVAASSLWLFACGETAVEPERTEPPSDVPLPDSVAELPKADQTAEGDPRPPVSLTASDGFLDVRGVGDAAWSRTHQSDPIAAEFGDVLDRWDPTGERYRGDLSFINWESVVGEGCDRFWAPYNPGRAYAFVSRAENLAQAYARGFNVVGLSNNHSRDCHDDSTDGEAGVDRTLDAMEALDDGRTWLWAGVARTEADKTRPVVTHFDVKGRTVRVAFASVYVGRSSCPRATCLEDAPALLEALGRTNVDLRILTIHSQRNHDQLISIGRSFIEDYDGDVVFGHGPHVWKPVHVIDKNGLGRGVMFESLGNFIHPSLRAQARNLVGRALFDLETLQLSQVQAMAVKTTGFDAVESSADPTSLEANVTWTADETVGAYADIKLDAVTLADLGCRDGFYSVPLESGGRFCDDGERGSGEITDAMRAACVEQGGTDCAEEVWPRAQLLDLRGAGLCPVGAWYDPRTQYCVGENEDALGPFPDHLVEACRMAGQDEPRCTGGRWPQRLLFELTRS